MNPAHAHLVLTHLPILGSLFGLFLLLIAIGLKSRQLKSVSLWVLVLAGLVAVPTYLTGRPASQLLMRAMPGMSSDPGDQHAEVAVIALTTASLLGLVALAGLLGFRRGRSIPLWFTALVLILGLVTTATMVWTANLGGRIRHSEIQAGPKE